MPQVTIFLDDKENKIVIAKADKEDLSKHEAIKRIIRESKIKEDENGNTRK